MLREDLEDDEIVVLPYAPAVDRDAFAMRVALASELGVATVADLAPHAPTLDFVAPPECPERPACLPHLEELGLHFRSFTGLPAGRTIALSLQAGEADVGLVFTTDPLIGEHGLIVLDDPQTTARPEHVVPLVRREVLDHHGGAIEAALAAVLPRLTTEALLGMNRAAADGAPVADVVREWLRG